MDKVISEEVAQKMYLQICDAFDSEADAENEKLFIQAIQEGRLELDEAKEELIYRLLAPVETGSVSMTEIRLHEPTAADCEYINRECKVISKNGETIIDLSAMYNKTIRMVTKLSGCMLAQAERIKRRDMPFLMAITNFFD